MDAIAKQTSEPANNGPEKSKSVFNPVVDDLAELFLFAGKSKEEIDALWIEFKKVQYIGDNETTGADIESSRACVVFANGVLAEANVQMTEPMPI